MSEEAGAPVAGSEAVESGQEPVSSVETGAPAETTDLFDNPEVQTFERPYVEDIRKEAARYRTEAKPFKEAFDGYTDEVRDAWLNVVNLAKSDESAAAQQLRELADAIAPPVEGAEDDEDAGTDEPQYLTKEQYEELRQQEQAEAAQAEQLQKLNTELTELGYTIPKDGEPPSIELAELMWFAQFKTGNDIKAAHEQVEARKQAVIDSYVQGKAGQKFPRQAFSQGEQAPAQTNKPKNLSESREYMAEYLKGQLG